MAGLAVLGLWASLLAAPPPTFDQAIEREASLLTREEAALEKALAEVESNGRTTSRALEGELARLTAQLAALEAENAGLERTLPSAERTRATEVQLRQLADLSTKITSWLRQRGVEVPGDGTDAGGPAPLGDLFAAALAEVRQRGGLRLDPAAGYFAADGTESSSPVLRVGRVAAVRWEGAGEPLVPIPGGLRIAQGITPERRSVVAGEVVKVLVVDPDEPPQAGAYAPSTWRAWMAAGGRLMWVLLAFAALAGLVALERTAAMVVVALRWRLALRRDKGLVELSDLDRAKALDADGNPVALPLATLARARAGGLRGVALEERVAPTLVPIQQRLQRRLPVLGIVAAVAPLTGLLGTVTGMIATFTVVTTQGTADPQALAGGISEALLTTQLGLTVAIPVLIVHTGLSRAGRRVLAGIESELLAAVAASGSGPTTGQTTTLRLASRNEPDRKDPEEPGGSGA